MDPPDSLLPLFVKKRSTKGALHKESTRIDRGTGLAPLARKRIVRTVLRLWTRLVDSQVTAVYGMAFQRTDRGLPFATISHGDECKPTRLTTHTIGYHMHVGDGAMRGKEIAQFVFGAGEGQISYVQFHNIFFRSSHRAVPDNRVSNHH